MDPEEDPDRAILWKIARKTEDGEVIDPELAETFKKIVRAVVLLVFQ